MYGAGANAVSLIEARKNFHQYGAVLAEYSDLVRAALPEEVNELRGIYNKE